MQKQPEVAAAAAVVPLLSCTYACLSNPLVQLTAVCYQT